MPRLSHPLSRALPPDWMQPLRDADRALRNFINPPLSRMRAWQGSMGDAQISARPLRAAGEKITWHIEVSRGGQRVGAFETVLSGQLSDAQFRNLRGGRPSPLKSQILDMLSAPQKRLHDLKVSVNVQNAPGGDSLQATIVAMQQYRDGKWQTQGYAVGEVGSYSPTPIYSGQRGEPLGYFRRSVGRGEAILRADGKPVRSLEEAKQLVQARLSNRSLTALSAAGAQEAARVRRQVQAETKPVGRSAAQIVPWQAPVALDKPLEKMNPTERIAYTVRVAKQYLPPDVADRLQALMTPQTLAALAAYAGSHALGVGFIGDGLGLAHMLAGMRDGLRQLDNYLRTTLRAKHPMELANAGRELSELMAPLLVDGSMLAASRVAGGMIGRGGIVPAQTAPTGVVDLGAQFPAVGALQTQLARNPEKALQALKTLVESGAEVTPQDILYAMQLNLAALKSKGKLTTDDKAYLKEYKVWADALQTKLGQAAKAPVAATAPATLTSSPPNGQGGALSSPRSMPTAPAAPVPTGSAAIQATNRRVPFIRQSPSNPNNPYNTLEKHQVPTSLSPAQVKVANSVNMSMALDPPISNTTTPSAAPEYGLNTHQTQPRTIKINYEPTTSLSESEKQLFSTLLSDGSVVENTLRKIEPSRLRAITDLESVDISLHSAMGQNRLVYKVTCRFKAEETPSIFIMKVARKNDVDSINQAILTKLIDQKLGRDFGIITNLNDGRMVITGPLIQGRMLSEFTNDANLEKYRLATIVESVGVWRTLGGFFILDPHANQFLINDDGEAVTASLIDKGAFRIKKTPSFAITRSSDGEIKPDLENITDLGNWLTNTSEVDLIDRLVAELAAAPPGQNLYIDDYVDPDAEMFGMVESRRTNPVKGDTVVMGVTEALGRDGALNFFSNFLHDKRRSRISDIQSIEEAIFRHLPELRAVEAASNTGRASELGAANGVFGAIVPKVSKQMLDDMLAQPGGVTARLPLGRGTEAPQGIYAVVERTPEGNRYYAEKTYLSQPLADRAVTALHLVSNLIDQGLMPGFDVVQILNHSQDPRIIQLSLVEGLDIERLMRSGSADPALREVYRRYRGHLQEAAIRLKAAGWDTELITTERGDYLLYVYHPRKGDGQRVLAFMVPETGVVATPDGRFVLIDPF